MAVTKEDLVSAVALIPLRGGGKRVGPINGMDKERAILGEHPLMAYTIRAAIDSGIFADVVAVVESEPHAEIAKEYGASVPFKRPTYTVRDGSPDIEWVLWAMNEFKETKDYDAYSILRVTSPFRSAENIKEAADLFFSAEGAHSLRTVTPVSQDPSKMWVIRQNRLLPMFPMGSEKAPWHSRPSQENFQAYSQTAGMEFAWTDMMFRTQTIAGSVVVPYVVEGLPALDINDKFDWFKAEQAIQHELAEIPESLK